MKKLALGLLLSFASTSYAQTCRITYVYDEYFGDSLNTQENFIVRLLDDRAQIGDREYSLDAGDRINRTTKFGRVPVLTIRPVRSDVTIEIEHDRFRPGADTGEIYVTTAPGNRRQVASIVCE